MANPLTKTNQQYDTVTFTAKVTDAATGKVMANNAKAYVILKIKGKTLKDSSNNTLKVKNKQRSCNIQLYT